MASDIFGKAFRKAAVEVSRQFEDPEAERKKAVKDAEQLLREEVAPMTAGDAIQRILLAWKDRDYFRLLSLPPVEVDALGNPSWDCTDADVSKAYRKLSILVHPDKNPGEDARQAFEHLNEAHRILKDPGKLADEKQRQLSAARERQAKREATATVQERVAINAARTKQAKELRQAEEEALRNAIAQQAKARREASQKRRPGKRSRREDSDDEALAKLAGSDDDEEGLKDGANGSDEDDDDDVAKRLARLKRPAARKRAF